ncbi:hypothetical protein PV327_004210 [Microctonus hyperodae]|uniref:DRBM domain-containing protein n=1 Tax=Microctonus hyperodae TaxID=165561 RepID=A0AA39KMA3_MICHY|nr:hypothetical protein PV327_004210 [Microctonus hyperodae]
MANNPSNPISVLQEYCQKTKLLLPRYTLVDQNGSPHCYTFTMKVDWNLFHTYAKSNTKQSAKYYAAEKMIDLMKQNNHKINYNNPIIHTPTTSVHQFDKEIAIKNEPESQPEIDSSMVSKINPIGELQEICVKYKMELPIYETRNTDSSNNFTVRCLVNDIIEDGTAPSKKKAKQNSAKQMKQRLIKLKLIRDDELNIICNSEVFNSPKDEHVLQLEELNLSGKKDLESIVTEEFENRFLSPEKKVRITEEDREDLSIVYFYSILKSSFDSTKRQKFQSYFEGLKIHELEYTPEHLESILENICEILNIKITKSNLRSEFNKFIVCYTFNKIPLLRNIGVGKDYNEARKSALINTIETIHSLLC